MLPRKLVGAFSQVSHKELYQGWKQTSVYLLVIHSASHYTSHFLSEHILISLGKTKSHLQFLNANPENNTCFGAHPYFAGTVERNLHQLSVTMSKVIFLVCGPTQKPGKDCFQGSSKRLVKAQGSQKTRCFQGITGCAIPSRQALFIRHYWRRSAFEKTFFFPSRQYEGFIQGVVLSRKALFSKQYEGFTESARLSRKTLF